VNLRDILNDLPASTVDSSRFGQNENLLQRLWIIREEEDFVLSITIHKIF